MSIGLLDQDNSVSSPVLFMHAWDWRVWCYASNGTVLGSSANMNHHRRSSGCDCCCGIRSSTLSVFDGTRCQQYQGRCVVCVLRRSAIREIKKQYPGRETACGLLTFCCCGGTLVLEVFFFPGYNRFSACVSETLGSKVMEWLTGYKYRTFQRYEHTTLKQQRFTKKSSKSKHAGTLEALSIIHRTVELYYYSVGA